MRLPESAIRNAVLHPLWPVREQALAWFTGSFSTDPTVMPLVIEAVGRYGHAEGEPLLMLAEHLPQTPATVDWLIGELGGEYDRSDIVEDNHRVAVSLVLAAADPALLVPQLEEILRLPGFARPIARTMVDFVEQAEWDWEQAWEAFLDAADASDESLAGQRRIEAIIATLARQANPVPGGVLQLLGRRYRGFNKLAMRDFEPHIIHLAGALHLREAMPLMLEYLHEEDDEVTGELEDALIHLGGDEVVAALAEQWDPEDEAMSRSTAYILGCIPGDLAVDTLLRLLPTAADEAGMEIAHSLLDQYAAEGIEPVRRLAARGLGETVDRQARAELRRDLVVTAITMEQTFPEMARWQGEAAAGNWGQGTAPERLAEEAFGFGGATDDDLNDSAWGEADEDENEDEGPAGVEAAPIAPPAPYKRPAPKVGRNDPCPCGSGKKYKKCCMDKIEGGQG